MRTPWCGLQCRGYFTVYSFVTMPRQGTASLLALNLFEDSCLLLSVLVLVAQHRQFGVRVSADDQHKDGWLLVLV